MQAMIRQAKANLQSHKLQSALIASTLFAAATLLSLALVTLYTARGGYNRLFERTHGAHLWLYLDPERVTGEEAEQALVGLPGVEATTGVVHALFPAMVAGEEPMKSQELREWPGEADAVACPLLVAGRAPQPGENDAIVLDRNAAAWFELEVGDRVDLPTPDGRRSLAIVGLQVGAGHCPFPSCQPGLNYVAAGTLDDLSLLLYSTPEAGSLVTGIRLQDPEIEALVQAIEERLPPASIYAWRDWQEIRRHCEESILVPSVLLTTFSIVAGLAAGFLIANAIGGAIRNQTRQIGLLKAVGFTGRQLAWIYLVEYLGLALVASLAGLVLGCLVAAVILRPVAFRFGETLARPPLWVALATPLATLLVSALFTLGPLRRAARLDVVQAIRCGAERPHRRAARLPRLPLPLAVGVSGALSRPLRSILTILGLGVAVVTMTFALTTVYTTRAYATDPSRGDLLVHSDLPHAETSRLIAARDDVVACYAERVASFQFDGDEEILQARFREGELETFQFPLIEGRMLEQPDGAVVSYVLAREQSLSPGSTTTILLEGESLTLRVVGIYREEINLGRMLVAPFEALRRVQPEAEPSYYIVKLDPEADVEAVAAALEAASGDLLNAESIQPSGATEELPRSMAMLSLVLGIIAMVGVLNTAWMGVQERRREFGLLKATGMTPAQVTLSVVAGAGGMGLAGYILGLLIGLPGVHLLFDVVGRAMLYGPFDATVDAVGQLLLLPAIVLLALAASFLPAHRAGRVSVVEVLRYE